MGDMADLDRERYEDYADWYPQEGRKHFDLFVEPPKAETAEAWLFHVEIHDHRGVDVGEDHWFPKSKCGYDEDEGRLVVPGWLLSSKGIAEASPDYMSPEDYL